MRWRLHNSRVGYKLTWRYAAACIGKASEPIGAYTSNAKGITWNM